MSAPAPLPAVLGLVWEDRPDRWYVVGHHADTVAVAAVAAHLVFEDDEDEPAPTVDDLVVTWRGHARWIDVDPNAEDEDVDMAWAAEHGCARVLRTERVPDGEPPAPGLFAVTVVRERREVEREEEYHRERAERPGRLLAEFRRLFPELSGSSRWHAFGDGTLPDHGEVRARVSGCTHEVSWSERNPAMLTTHPDDVPALRAWAEARRAGKATQATSAPSTASLLPLADLVLRFGLVRRATLHADGVTWESDTTHTVMLAVVACAIAAQHPELGLDLGLVSQLATVHDLVEAYAGDTDTFQPGAGDGATFAGKAERERAALERIRTDCAGWPWVARMIETYEAQACREARFVRYADKILPRLTNALNGGDAIRARGHGKAESFTHDRRLIGGLAKQYPEFASVLDPLLRLACDEAEAAWKDTP